jgi:16S rRNA (guanine966-N2)-methyltransferase
MSKPRIIGGVAKGRSLEVPKSGTRPSPSRLREALFNIIGFRPRGTFLDLYSGSGAVGLEAASRGWQATCVDKSRDAAAVIRKNAQALKLDAEVVQGDALTYAKNHPHSFEIVFAAPPYPLDLGEIFGTILAAEVATALYIFQHPTGMELIGDRRVYGSNTLTLIEAETVEPESLESQTAKSETEM